jgi:caffeoyl-CoA O-methyltransferase
MTDKYTVLDERLYAYLLAQGVREDEVLRELREETARLGRPARMQIAPDQGALLRLLVAAIGARRAVEVGTFTGYSGLCIARGLGPEGRLLCCDVSDEWTRIARRYWERAGVADRIELRLGPALDTLRALPLTPSFDFAFIDADKLGYLAYYDELLARTRPGGLIAVDNVLWDGRVADLTVRDDETRGLRRFNEVVAADPRVEIVMLAVADGLTLARKL